MLTRPRTGEAMASAVWFAFTDDMRSQELKPTTCCGIDTSSSKQFSSAIFATDRCNTGGTALFAKKIVPIYQPFRILPARPLALTANLQVMQRN